MDVCFSNADLAPVAGIVVALAGAIGVLFRALLAAKDASITRLQNEVKHLEADRNHLIRRRQNPQD